MASNIETTIYARINGDSNLFDAVNGNIFSEFRFDNTPAIVIEIDLDETAPRYEGAGVFYYSLTVSCIAKKMIDATAIADSVVEYLKDSKWSDAYNTVIDVTYEGRQQSYLQDKGEHDRVAIVDCRFDLLAR
jgi:hypothetical protein